MFHSGTLLRTITQETASQTSLRNYSREGGVCVGRGGYVVGGWGSNICDFGKGHVHAIKCLSLQKGSLLVLVRS